MSSEKHILESSRKAASARLSVAVGLWACAAILAGTILTSYHQPFQSPSASILSLHTARGRSGWRALHVLSESCGCSKQVMERLIERGPAQGTTESIVLADDDVNPLEGSAGRIASLVRAGFVVSHVPAAELRERFGLRGVPLLVLGSPTGKVVYLGGYGVSGDGTDQLREVQAGDTSRALPVLGCAISSALRRAADPFALKYRDNR